MQLDQDQIETLLLAVTDVVSADYCRSMLYNGHIWTYNGMLFQAYDPYGSRYVCKPYTLDRLQAICAERGLEQIEAFFQFYTLVRYRRQP